MIYISTDFGSEFFLKRKYSAKIWQTAQNQWFLTYNGPPDFLKVDQGSEFVSREMRSIQNYAGVQLCETPVVNPRNISTVESHHA